jgi:hypothetical protein
MIQRGGGLRLPPESFEQLVVVGQMLREKLRGDKVMKLGVLRLVDQTHPSATEFF